MGRPAQACASPPSRREVGRTRRAQTATTTVPNQHPSTTQAPPKHHPSTTQAPPPPPKHRS
eukprot:11204181-Lingulodinium_polyedra.AAC.1